MPSYAYPTAGANLGFKVGTQASVDTIITNQTAVEGSFYLTSDTHRLYIGNNDNTLSPVNEGILKFANMTQLRAALSNNTGTLAGRFAYIENENILAVHNGTQWIQINTFTDTKVTSFGNSPQRIDDYSISVDHTIGDNNGDDYHSRYVLKGENGTKVSVGTNTTIIVNGSQVSVPTFVITGDTYTLAAAAGSTNQAKIQLSSTNTDNDSEVTLNAGTNSNMTISRNGNVISFTSDDTRNSTLQITNLSDGFHFKITDSQGDSVERDFKPSFKYGNNQTAYFDSNGIATFDIYSKGQIDETIRLLNAMTYKGTLGTGGSAGTYIDATTKQVMLTSGGTSTPVDTRIGDTFLASSVFVYNGTSVPVGSLIIAKGTEDTTTGYITSNFDYDIITSTINTDTQYKFKRNATNNGVELIPIINGTEGLPVGELVFTGSTDITVSTSTGTTDGGGTKETISVTHKAVTRTNTTGTAIAMDQPTDSNNFFGSKKVSVVTGVTSSSTGHVTGVETTEITLTDDAGRITGQDVTGSSYKAGNTSVGVISQKITETYHSGDRNESTAYFGINSDSLTIEADNTQQVSASDTSKAKGLKINMVWGSF